MTVDDLLGVIPKGQKIKFVYDCCYEPLVWEKDIDYDDFIYEVIPFESKAFLESEVLIVYTCEDDALYVDIELF